MTALSMPMGTSVEAVRLRLDRTVPQKVKPSKIRGFHPNLIAFRWIYQS